MGANNSTRKITLVSDDKAGVIKLSESLAHRLRGQLENGKTSDQEGCESEQKPSSAPEPPVHHHLPPTPPPTPPQLEQHSQCENEKGEKSGEEVPAWSIYAKDAHLMNSRLKEEKELEMKLKDEEWRRKIKEREQQYAAFSQLSQDHMQNTIKEVEGLFSKVSCSPVCQDQQQGVMKCYQQHSSQSLRCSDEVESFARCVDLSRLQSFKQAKAS